MERAQLILVNDPDLKPLKLICTCGKTYYPELVDFDNIVCDDCGISYTLHIVMSVYEQLFGANNQVIKEELLDTIRPN